MLGNKLVWFDLRFGFIFKFLKSSCWVAAGQIPDFITSGSWVAVDLISIKVKSGCWLFLQIFEKWLLSGCWPNPCFKLQLYTPLCWSVRPLVCPSKLPLVRPSHFTFIGFLRIFVSLLLPKWSGDLNYSPCPPTRDWGSRLSGRVVTSGCRWLLALFLLK